MADVTEMPSDQDRWLEELNRDRAGSIRERLIRFLCRRYGLPPVKAEELADDAVATAKDKISKYDSTKRATLSTWVFRIAINKTKDYFKSPSARMAPVSLDDIKMETIPSQQPGPEETYRRKRSAEKLRAALDRLPKLQGEAMELCQLRGYRREEAAGILHVPVRRLDEALRKARLTLRQNRDLWEEYHGCDHTTKDAEAEQSGTRRNERVLRRIPRR
jgi:RNA polymerase sigma factor (sigma-70 family)